MATGNATILGRPEAALAPFVLFMLSRLLVRAMIARGSMDVPGARSSHDTPTPRGGGIGPVAALALGLLAGGGLALHAGAADARPFGVLVATLLLAWVSHRDDVRQGHFRDKLAAQLAAGVIVVAGGVIAPHPAGLAWTGLAGVVTVLWLLFATNAMNFIDGLNGLASGAMLLAALAVGSVAMDHPALWITLGAIALTAGLAGFMPYNYPKARIFLGDVGSQSCGFAVAALGVALAGIDGPPQVAFDDLLLVPALLFGIYADVFFTLLRRWRAGERVTQAHRSHLYQLAQRSFLPAPYVSALHFVFVGIGYGTWRLWAISPAGAVAVLVIPQIVWATLVLIKARHLLRPA